jgi:hypothetical protein
MVEGQFPFGPGAVLGAQRQDPGREHAVDLEKLELDRAASRIRRRIDKSQGPAKVAAMVAGGFGDEKGRAQARVSCV